MAGLATAHALVSQPRLVARLAATPSTRRHLYEAVTDDWEYHDVDAA